MRDELRPGLAAFCGASILALLFGQLLQPDACLAVRDILYLHLPLLADLKRLAAQGWPAWNPLIHGGQPILANPHYALFYPPVWLVLLLPVHLTIGVLICLHAVWGFLGAWRFAARLGAGPEARALAAVAFAAGGAVSSAPNLLNVYLALAWLPWVLLWGDRTLHATSGRAWWSGVGLTSLALAAQMFAGSPEMPLIGALALCCLAIEPSPAGPRRFLRLAPIGALAALVAGAQLLPTARALADSPRSAGVGTETALSWSTPPWRLVEWIWPRIFGNPALHDSGFYFGYPALDHDLPLLLSIYCGTLILVLALAAMVRGAIPRRRALIAMFLTGAFLALGRFNPLYGSLLAELPPFSLIRYPEKFLLLSTTAIAFAAALGWNRLLEARQHRGSRNLAAATTVAAAALIASLLMIVLPILIPQLALDLVAYKGVQATATAVAATEIDPETLAGRVGYLGRETFIAALVWLATLLVVRLHASERVPRSRLAVLVLLFVGFDLWLFGREHNVTIPAAPLWQPPTPLAGASPSTTRVFSDEALFLRRADLAFGEPRDGLPITLSNSLWRLDPYTANLWEFGYALNEDFDLMMTRTARQALRTFHLGAELSRRGWNDRALRLLGAWNIGIIARRRDPEALQQEFETLGGSPVPARLTRNPHVLPRIRFVSQGRFLPDTPAAVRAASDAGFELENVDYVVAEEESGKQAVRGYDATATLLDISDRGGHIDIDYRSPGPALLVVADTYHPDWHADLAGQRLAIHRTALGQMAIELPAGESRLELRHRDPTLGPGVGLTLIGIVTCLLLQTTRRIRTRA